MGSRTKVGSKLIIRKFCGKNRACHYTKNWLAISCPKVREYPDIKQAYQLSTDLTNIFNQKIDKRVALTKLARWFNEAEASGFKAFATIRGTFEQHYATIVNYFEDRETNAYAESFNSKIKDFRRNFRGVRDIRFFLFRLNNIFG